MQDKELAGQFGSANVDKPGQAPPISSDLQMFSWAAASTGKDTTAEAKQTLDATKAAAETPDAKVVDEKQAAADKLAADNKTAEDVKAQYGTRPHKFGGNIDGDTRREKTFLAALPKIVAQLNAIAEKKGVSYRFTEAELATNFITEGGWYLLQEQFTLQTPQGPVTGSLPETNIDGFQALGIDTFMSRRQELKPWMSNDLNTWSGDKSHRLEAENENHQKVQSMTVRDIAQGTEANAVMFAAARDRFNNDCEAMKFDTASLPEEAWFFWTTIYFNAGEGVGKNLLKQHGIDFWKTKWKLPDDNKKYNQNATYNAHWRTATWDYMRKTEGDDLQNNKTEKETQP